MKTTVHYRFASKETKGKLPCIGDALNPVKTYTKADFLTSEQVAQKFNISKELAENIMKNLEMNNTSFVLNGHMAKVVVDMRTNGLFLHPMGIDIFKQCLEKRKVK